MYHTLMLRILVLISAHSARSHSQESHHDGQIRTSTLPGDAHSLPYFIKESKGRGLGVFASRALEPGEVILNEAPVIKIRMPAGLSNQKGYPYEEVESLLERKYDRLSSDEQPQINDLVAAAGNGIYSKDGYRLSRIFKNNAYTIGDEVGLFPRIARINHSCRPNTSYRWDQTAHELVMYANRNITAGEEILDSYISLLQSRSDRRKQLLKYGFTCGCEACDVDDADAKTSDARRFRIKRAFENYKADWTTLETAQDLRDSKLAAKDSLELIDDVHAEGLAGYYANVYKLVAVSHARIEDWQTATIWANKGYEIRVTEGANGSDLREMYHLTSSFIEKWQEQVQGTRRDKEEL